MSLQDVPCHLITGPLGVGKTTAVLQYLRRHAGRQFIAVLVNDFGPVGLDGQIMNAELGPEAGKQTKVMMVPGGCICCSAVGGLIGGFEELSKLQKIDRIIVEPSGLAVIGEMIDLLMQLQAQHGFDLRPVITLLDPKDLSRPGFTRAPYYVRLFEAADILVANRTDLAGPQRTQEFQEWAMSLYPPKLRIVLTEQGRLDDEIFQLTRPRQKGADVPASLEQLASQNVEFLPMAKAGSPAVVPRPKLSHTGHDHAGGLQWPAERRFAFSALLKLLNELAAAGLDGVPLARLKALLHTDRGWKLLEIARGAVHERPTDYRRDNRMDWISEGAPLDARRFEQRWNDALTVPER